MHQLDVIRHVTGVGHTVVLMWRGEQRRVRLMPGTLSSAQCVLGWDDNVTSSIHTTCQKRGMCVCGRGRVISETGEVKQCIERALVISQLVCPC